MKADVSSVSPIVEPVAAAPSPQDGRRSSQQDPASDAERLARYRLVIEGEPNAGFVYKTLDRTTGEVVNQFPREAVLKLREDPGYASGSVIDTTA